MRECEIYSDHCDTRGCLCTFDGPGLAKDGRAGMDNSTPYEAEGPKKIKHHFSSSRKRVYNHRVINPMCSPPLPYD